MPHRIVAAALQQVDEPDNVTVDVRIWVLDRIAHTCLGSKVAHNIEPLLGEHTLQRLAILQLEPHEAVIPVTAACQLLAVGGILDPDPDTRQAAVLHPNVVVVVDRVDAYDIMSLFGQTAADIVTYESGRAGNKYLHFKTLFNQS